MSRFLLPERLFLLLVIPLQLFYLFAYNPLLDYTHGTERFLHAAHIANTMLGEQGTLPRGMVTYTMEVGRAKRIKASIPAKEYRSVRQEVVQMHANRPAHMGVVPQWLAAKNDLGRENPVSFESAANPKVYSPLTYAPEVIGCLIGIAMDMAPSQILLLALLVKFAAAVLLGYYTLKLTPALKWQMLALLLLPTLFLTRSVVMSDPVTIGLTQLFIAAVLHFRVHGLPRRGIALLSLLSLLIGQFKSVYVGVTVLAWLLPQHSFRSFRHKLAMVAVMVGIGLLSSLAWGIYTLEANGYDLHNPSWNAGRMETRMEEIKESPGETVQSFIRHITHPRTYIDGEKNLLSWKEKLFGAGEIAGHVFLLLWLASSMLVLPGDRNIALKWWERGGCAGIFLVTCLASAIVSELFFPRMLGSMQGRYLLPAMPLLCLAVYHAAPFKSRALAALPAALIALVLYLNFLVLQKLYGI